MQATRTAARTAAPSRATSTRLQDILLLIGQLNYTWTNTESLLIHMIAGLAKVDKETAIVIFLTLNTTRARIDLVDRLTKMRKTAPVCRREILKPPAAFPRKPSSVTNTTTASIHSIPTAAATSRNRCASSKAGTRSNTERSRNWTPGKSAVFRRASTRSSRSTGCSGGSQNATASRPKSAKPYPRPETFIPGRKPLTASANVTIDMRCPASSVIDMARNARVSPC